uniref:Uncharacterized protein n=1 Tax=Anopheles gambiae TaxID=7165 RepID=A0A1S4H0Z0_ANOGA
MIFCISPKISSQRSSSMATI